MHHDLKLYLPDPEVLAVLGNIFYDPKEARHLLTFEVVSFKSAHTNTLLAGYRPYHSRILSSTIVCKESRHVYLNAFPISVPVELGWNDDRPLNDANRGTIKARIHISRQNRLFIAKMEEILLNPYLEEALSSQQWTSVITTLYGSPCGSFFPVSDNMDDAFNTPIWTAFKAFPKMRELRAVIPDNIWQGFIDRSVIEENRRVFGSIRKEWEAVRFLHGLEKELPEVCLTSVKNMQAMNDEVLRERSGDTTNSRT